MHDRSLTGRDGFWSGWAIGASLCFALFIAVLMPPFVSIEVRHAIMLVFSTVCHQIPDRSPIVDGVQLAVCHRCIGIYAALATAPIGFLFLRRWDSVINRSARWLVVAAVAVPGADWLVDVMGLWSNTPLSRAATGAVFGFIVGYFLCRAFVELVKRGDGEARLGDPLPVGSGHSSDR